VKCSIETTLASVLDWLWHTDPLDEGIVHTRARALLLDTVGCAIAGLSKPEPAALAARLGSSDSGDVVLPGMAAGVSTGSAAYLIALGACWDEACEGLARAHGRPGLHAVPVALALGLFASVPYADVLRAMIRGYEVAGRLGERLRIPPGMHVDGTWGTFGATTAAASMLNLSSEQALIALRAAACQVPWSMYLPVAEGATARNLYVAEAVARGLRITQSVAAGVTAPSGALDAFDAKVLGGVGAEGILAPPDEWLLPQGYLKPYAAVRHVHYAAAAALRWHEASPANTAQILTMRVQTYREAITYCGNRAPRTAIQAQFSISFGVAAALVLGDLGPGAYAASALFDPEIMRLESVIEIVPYPDCNDESARAATVSITMAKGTVVYESGNVPGDARSPMVGQLLREKFARYVEPVLGRARTDDLAVSILEAPGNVPMPDVTNAS
jgi:2-methylcitrate dehydratase PrpD